MVLPNSAVERVVELGIDDFAFRRGKNFGTILVDMQSHKVIDPRRLIAKLKPQKLGCKRTQKSRSSVGIAGESMLLELVKGLHKRPKLLIASISIKI